MNILLIDDNALTGWKEILEKVFFHDREIDYAIDKTTAIDRLTKKYDLIFLDLRFGEKDHREAQISQFTGFKLLSEYIRNSFKSINYPTPVIVFSASNKVWNIMEMLENGADDYYIKEHPSNARDLEFSRKNFIRMKGSDDRKGVLEELFLLNDRRSFIWVKINDILSKLNLINNKNIKIRIEEKLKIGYGLLFRGTKEIDRRELLFNNEIIAFIVFWSILEEISKDSFKDNWIKSGDNEGSMNDNKWILKNGSAFIEDNRTTNFDRMQGYVSVNIKWDGQKYCNQNQKIFYDNKDINYYTGKISLSKQIYALMLLGKLWPSLDPKLTVFEKLNDYRNEIDFIHSSVSGIFNENLSVNQDSTIGYDMCVKMLDFIYDLIN
jgi:CheY-like chemotaxis protein